MKRHKERKGAKKPLKINLRRSVRIKHGLWCKWAVDQLDQRTREGKWAKGMREDYIRELKHQPTLNEQLAIDHLVIDELKKRKYDEGIFDGKLYGSKDMGKSISESIERRLTKRMGIRNPEKPQDLETYLRNKEAESKDGHR